MSDFRQELRSRLSGLSISPAREAEIVEEIAQDLEDRRADLIAAGKSAAEADAELIAVLDQDLTREIARIEPQCDPLVTGTTEKAGPLTDLWRDVRYAARALAKSRAFTIVTLLSLAYRFFAVPREGRPSASA